MEYKEQFNSRLIFGIRETRRKQKLFHKKVGKVWRNKKEYTTHFVSTRLKKHVSKGRTVQPLSREPSAKSVSVKTKQQGKPLGKLAIYTCIFGGYDNLQEPLIKSKYCDYYIVTDKSMSQKSTWKKLSPKQYPQGFDSWHPAIKNRYYKMHPKELFPDYEYSLYIDGNIRPVTDLFPFLIAMEKEGKVFGLFEHPVCHDVYEMTDMVKAENLVSHDIADLQMQKYHSECFPEKWGLFECGFILREHNNDRCKEVMKTWWEEFLNGEKRDQMCFTYALWKNGFAFDDVCCFGKNIRKNSRLKLSNHNRAHSKVQ